MYSAFNSISSSGRFTSSADGLVSDLASNGVVGLLVLAVLMSLVK